MQIRFRVQKDGGQIRWPRKDRPVQRVSAALVTGKKKSSEPKILLLRGGVGEQRVVLTPRMVRSGGAKHEKTNTK